MNMFVLLLIFVILLVIFAVLGSFLWLFDASFGGLDLVSGRGIAKIVSGVIRSHNLQNGRLYDLGSCRGSFVFSLIKFCPNLKIVGIDNSRFRIAVSKLRGFFHRGQIIFIRDNFFKADFSAADAVFLYLDSSVLADLENKLRAQLKPGSLIITHHVSFPAWPPVESYLMDEEKPEKGLVYVYVV